MRVPHPPMPLLLTGNIYFTLLDVCYLPAHTMAVMDSKNSAAKKGATGCMLLCTFAPLSVSHTPIGNKNSFFHSAAFLPVTWFAHVLCTHAGRCNIFLEMLLHRRGCAAEWQAKPMSCCIIFCRAVSNFGSNPVHHTLLVPCVNISVAVAISLIR